MENNVKDGSEARRVGHTRVWGMFSYLAHRSLYESKSCRGFLHIVLQGRWPEEKHTTPHIFWPTFQGRPLIQSEAWIGKKYHLKIEEIFGHLELLIGGRTISQSIELELGTQSLPEVIFKRKG